MVNGTQADVKQLSSLTDLAKLTQVHVAFFRHNMTMLHFIPHHPGLLCARLDGASTLFLAAVPQAQCTREGPSGQEHLIQDGST